MVGERRERREGLEDVLCGPNKYDCVRVYL